MVRSFELDFGSSTSCDDGEAGCGDRDDSYSAEHDGHGGAMVMRGHHKLGWLDDEKKN